MRNPNWIPIERFNKETQLEVQHLFLTQSIDGKSFSLDAGYWAHWGAFYNGDGEFEPTHFLRPAVWQDIPDPDPLEAVRYWLMRVHELSQITPVSFQRAAESDNFPLPPTNS